MKGCTFKFTYKSRLAAVEKKYASLLSGAREKAAKATSNSVLRITMPFTARDAQGTYLPPSKGLKKGALNTLRNRIHWDIIGNIGKKGGKLGKDIRTAIVDGAGGFLPGSLKGTSQMPFVVPETRGRKKKNDNRRPPRDMVTSPTELVRRIEQATVLRLNKRRHVQRFRKSKNIELFWTTLDTAKRATAIFKTRAGYLLSGWHMLAAVTQNPNFASIVNRGMAHAPGTASIKNEKDSLFLSAANKADLPPGSSRWQQRVLTTYIPNTFRRLFENEMSYANMEIDKFIKRLK
jgi:hypothetical protein